MFVVKNKMMATKKSETAEGKLISTELGPRTQKEVWKDWTIATGKYIGKKIHSPFGIYLLSTWFISFLIMGITNTMRGGKFFEGPSYWIDIFLTYGLNNGQNSFLRLIAKPFLVWFFAPMVVLILGWGLFLLADSGFLRNGALPIDELDFNQTQKFFSYDNIWGQDLINPARPKWTKMYIWLVLMPIILGAAFTGVYNFIVFKLIKKDKFIPSAKKFLLVIATSCFIIGVEMALMTGNITLEFTGLFYSLFVDRTINDFIIYGTQYKTEGEKTHPGQYHPIAVALTLWLLYLIPFFVVYLVLLIVGNLDNVWKNRNFLFKWIKKFIESRQSPDLEV